MIVQQCPSNPFSAKYLAPGYGEFIVPTTWERLLACRPTRTAAGTDRDQYLLAVTQRFQQANSIGQIVGPHGCGKTTLAHAMVAQLSEDFGDVRWLTIRNRQPTPFGSTGLAIQEISPGFFCASHKSLLVVDGFESLSWVNRMLMVANIRIAGMGLLVTTHRRHLGIAVVQQLQPDKTHFRKIALSKCGSTNRGISNAIMDRAFDSAQHDYREALMRLYDLASRSGP